MKRIIPSICAFLIVSMLISCGSGGRLRSDSKNSFAYHYNLGLAAFEQGDYQIAIGHFERSIKLNFKVARTHNELGMCYLFLNRNEKAIPCFEKALELDPRFAEAHNNLGIALYGVNRLDDAEAQFQVVLTTPEYGTKFIPLYNLGNIYQLKGELNKALSNYERALKDEAKVPTEYRTNIRNQIGNTYYKLGQYDKALEQFEIVLILNPRFQEVLYLAGECALLIKDNEKARKHLMKLMTVAAGTQMESKARELLKRMEQ